MRSTRILIKKEKLSRPTFDFLTPMFTSNQRRQLIPKLDAPLSTLTQINLFKLPL